MERDALEQLRATPLLLARVAGLLSDEQLVTPPDPKAWSLNDVLAHLRGAADVRGAWIARILAEDTPTIRYTSPRSGMKKGGYATHGFHASLAAFTEQRTHLVAALTTADWARGATFTGGKPGPQTVRDLVVALAEHERTHVEQIEAFSPPRSG